MEVTPELVLVDPELAEAQRQTTQRKAAMSSNEPANEMYSVDRSHNQPAQGPPPATPPAPAPEPEPSTPTNPPAQMVDVPLGTLIFRAGLLGEEQLEDALEEGMRTGKRLGEVLLERGWLNEGDLGRMLAAQKGLPFVEVSAADAEPEALEVFAEEKARRQAALPLRYEDGLLVIAVGDPSNELVLESLRRDFGSGFRLVVAPHGQLQHAIDEAYALLAAQPEPPPVADPAPPAQPELPVDAHPEPQPESEPGAQSEPSPQPEHDDEPEPLPEQAPEPEASAEEEPEYSHQPFAGSTPKLLSRMLFPSVRHAVHEPDAEPQETPAPQPDAEAQETPAPEEDLAQLQVTEVPELSISTAEQEAPESEAAPLPEESAEAEPPTEQPEPEPADEAIPSGYHVLVRLRDGELVPVGRFQTAAEASARAQEAIGEIASAENEATWPLFAGRYLRPDTIVSVDLLEESPDA